MKRKSLSMNRTVALVMLNRGAQRKAAVSFGGGLAEISLPGRALATLLIL